MNKLNRTISYPYAVLSDIHFHNWKSFSHINENGINNRLQIIVDAVLYAADTLIDCKGKDIIITGDVFHTRGKLNPSVLNPVIDCFKNIITNNGANIYILAGNHDLEFKNSDNLGSALGALAEIDGVYVFNKTTLVGEEHLFIPWHENFGNVLHIANKKAKEISKLTVFCHVGLNGVIPANLGDTINPFDFSKELKYVFSGHFHNHVNFGNRVYSVGALTHQTWSDVGSKAGFLIVRENQVIHVKSDAPRFIEWALTGHEPTGPNYVKIKNVTLPQKEADMFKQQLLEDGVLAVIDESTRPTIKRDDRKYEIEIDRGADTALTDYCMNTFGDDAKEVLKKCFDLMS